MTPIDTVVSELWPERSGAEVYAILDGARSPRVHASIRDARVPARCLYAGTLSPGLEEAAPHLVHLPPGTTDLVELAWGASWGIFVRSAATLENLRRHFRRFLRVRTETGRNLVFRYYDPRVFRVYLPTCTRDEIAALFGPVTEFVVEGDSPDTVLRFGRSASGDLETSRVDVPGSVQAAPAVETAWA